MATDNSGTMRNLTNALSASAADFAHARNTGSSEATAVIGTLNDAVRIVSSARSNGQHIDETLNQRDAFSDPVDEETAHLARFIALNTSKPKALDDTLKALASMTRQRAESSQSGSLFEDDTTTGDITDEAIRRSGTDQNEQAPNAGTTPADAGNGQAGDSDSQQQSAEGAEGNRAEEPADVDDEPLLSTYSEDDIAAHTATRTW